jgi:hypothetical protein
METIGIQSGNNIIIPYYNEFYMPDIFPSEAEAKRLIKTPKIYTGHENHHFPPNGEEINIPLVSEFGDTDFILDIESKSLTLHGYKYQQRVYKSIILVRVDLGPKPHYNPGRVLVPGPHIHIYKEGYHDKIAYPLPNKEITQMNDKMAALDEFMNYCNIIQKPIIREGISND